MKNFLNVLIQVDDKKEHLCQPQFLCWNNSRMKKNKM